MSILHFYYDSFLMLPALSYAESYETTRDH